MNKKILLIIIICLVFLMAQSVFAASAYIDEVLVSTKDCISPPASTYVNSCSPVTSFNAGQKVWFCIKIITDVGGGAVYGKYYIDGVEKNSKSFAVNSAPAKYQIRCDYSNIYTNNDAGSYTFKGELTPCGGGACNKQVSFTVNKIPEAKFTIWSTSVNDVYGNPKTSFILGKEEVRGCAIIMNTGTATGTSTFDHLYKDIKMPEPSTVTLEPGFSTERCSWYTPLSAGTYDYKAKITTACSAPSTCTSSPKSFTVTDSCTSQTWYKDSDGDGYGISSDTKSACPSNPPPGYADKSGDCKEGDKTKYQYLNCNYDGNSCLGSYQSICTGSQCPTKPAEICGNNFDDNCDGNKDENCCISHDHKVCSNDDVYWADSCGGIEDIYLNCANNEGCKDGKCVLKLLCTDFDNDNYDVYDALLCPSGNDCNDLLYIIHPNAEEQCNGYDDNCDGVKDEGCQCVNGDKKQCGTTDVGECSYGTDTCVNGKFSGVCAGVVEPVAEICYNFKDDDCDTKTDFNDEDCLFINKCEDIDGDGYKVHKLPYIGETFSCTPPQQDCDDNNPDKSPGKDEILCNEIDDDCNPATIDNPCTGNNICDTDFNKCVYSASQEYLNEWNSYINCLNKEAGADIGLEVASEASGTPLYNQDNPVQIFIEEAGKLTGGIIICTGLAIVVPGTIPVYTQCVAVTGVSLGIIGALAEGNSKCSTNNYGAAQESINTFGEVLDYSSSCNNVPVFISQYTEKENCKFEYEEMGYCKKWNEICHTPYINPPIEIKIVEAKSKGENKFSFDFVVKNNVWWTLHPIDSTFPLLSGKPKLSIVIRDKVLPESCFGLPGDLYCGVYVIKYIDTSNGLTNSEEISLSLDNIEIYDADSDQSKTLIAEIVWEGYEFLKNEPWFNTGSNQGVFVLDHQSLNQKEFQVKSNQLPIINSVICNSMSYSTVLCPVFSTENPNEKETFGNKIDILAGDKLTMTLTTHDVDGNYLEVTYGGDYTSQFKKVGCIDTNDGVTGKICTFTFTPTQNDVGKLNYHVNFAIKDDTEQIIETYYFNIKENIPEIISPKTTDANKGVTQSQEPLFEWENIDGKIPVKYYIRIYNSFSSEQPVFTSKYVNQKVSTTETNYKMGDHIGDISLNKDTSYWWKVTALNEYDVELNSTKEKFYVDCWTNDQCVINEPSVFICENGAVYEEKKVGYCKQDNLLLTEFPYCTSKTEKTKQDCQYGCSDGACLPKQNNIPCYSDDECGIQKPLSKVCQGSDVYDQVNKPICENPGTISSKCNNNNIISQLTQTCEYGCENSMCKSKPTDPDTDNDAVPDNKDNCIQMSNKDQKDLDLDGKGDVCDDDMDGDGVVKINDCNDANQNINPNKQETCNNIDDDCDGLVDEGVTIVQYKDSDLDGHGNKNEQVLTCKELGKEYVSTNDDCDDTNSNVYPTAEEICDGLDNNCDGIINNNINPKYIDCNLNGGKQKQTCNNKGEWENEGTCSDSGVCTNSDTMLCQTSAKGECGFGMKTCNNGAWGQCVTNKPKTEVCNKVDDDCDGEIDEDNICAEPLPTELPDLYATSPKLLQLKWDSGEECKAVFEFTVKNKGETDAENIKWVAETNTGQYLTGNKNPIPTIKKGKEVLIVPQFKFSGTIQPVFYVDKENSVAELDETNNFLPFTTIECDYDINGWKEGSGNEGYKEAKENGNAKEAYAKRSSDNAKKSAVDYSKSLLWKRIIDEREKMKHDKDDNVKYAYDTSKKKVDERKAVKEQNTRR